MRSIKVLDRIASNRDVDHNNYMSLESVDLGSGLSRAQLRYPNIDLKNCKLIGWGGRKSV